ncbi:hypothetical protein PFICI_02961 [Pestalotiopsis fici W106-1]|uniref:Uncharacterized protein n=1 Tax=Pestalotiopsis fici (strain W106-1 / CGMCC3.15140) TaxID=1229662 RepID=W3XI63_PESFW|nr:uncharacterized protein PFICI_02961 [Pestalotiopsis fici W106-1]ETS84936.1 hypothetical protein PFICI_02961 [Pestalotiopsis fici W106-1]
MVALNKLGSRNLPSHLHFPPLAQPPSFLFTTTTQQTWFLAKEPISYDRHDRNDPSSTTEPQRQQRPSSLLQTPPPRVLTITPEHRSQTPSSQHRLRRTPRLPATPSPEPARPEPRQPRPTPAADHPQPVVTLGDRNQNVQAHTQEKGKTVARPRLPPRQLSQDLSSEDNEEEDSPISLRQKNVLDLPDPESIFRISKRTHRAVLYTLEELLRGPFKLTPDIVEESASMADLLGGNISTSNGNVPSSSRMPAARAPAGSPSSGIRGPRMIMQERAAREARQREERERLEREHAAEEARLVEEATQREAERREIERRAAAGAGAEARQPVPVGDATHRRTARAGSRSGPDPSALYPDASRPAGNVAPQPSQRQTETLHGQPPAADEAAGALPQPQLQPGQTSEQLGAAGRGRNSFPSAFERWETLSAHWEGLLSFWLRKLKQNADEINNDPVSKHLARNVEDLSSAGANLFHAVVELQRLRASSERKFQRWFFDTRTEIERHQEVTAMLEAALEKERLSRADAIREALEHERGNSRTQKQISELRKELQISKEEARRAWDELGRREQEERDRTASLQQGHPTIVGGVQVVPMTQGVSRHSSRRDQQAYGSGEPEYSQTSSSRPEYGEAPAVQPVVTSSPAPGPSYQPSATVHHQGSYGSEGTYSESEYTMDAHGNFVRDSRRDRMPFHAPALDSDSDAGIDEFETPGLPPATQPPSSTGAEPQYSQVPDYSSGGYNSPSWEAGARHHHPTRLSDVLEEEEERSRTSASQSQVSRG